MGYTRIKICGITNLEDAQLAVLLGADALGFIFCDSPRQITVSQAKVILEKIPPFVNKVAVIKDFPENKVREIISKLPIDTLQFHGKETQEFCLRFNSVTLIKVISIHSEDSLTKLIEYPKLSHFLLDTYSKQGGGSGRTFNWELVQKAKKYGNIVLAGGLNPDNIRSAIEKVAPYGVDVSSGVEKAYGIKDPTLLKQFFHQIRETHL